MKESQTKNAIGYMAPEIAFAEIKVEKGFADSPGGGDAYGIEAPSYIKDSEF